MVRNSNDVLNDVINGISSAILVEKPCKIINIHSQYCVDIEYYDNNVADCLYKVPVKHIQTSKAYVYLGLSVGDRGTVRFFDTDVSNYKSGSSKTGGAVRRHNINDNIFTCGFYPSPSQYLFPSGDVVIGTTSGAQISISGNEVAIVGGSISITGGTVTLDGNTTIDGKVFLEHTHSNGNEGSPTGAVI